MFHECSKLHQSSLFPPWFSFDLCFMNVLWVMSILFFLLTWFFLKLSHINLFYLSWVLSCVLYVFIVVLILSSLGAIFWSWILVVVLLWCFKLHWSFFPSVDFIMLCYVVPLMFFELRWSSSLRVNVLFMVCSPNNVDLLSSLHAWSLFSSCALLITSILFLVWWSYFPQVLSS